MAHASVAANRFVPPRGDGDGVCPWTGGAARRRLARVRLSGGRAHQASGGPARPRARVARAERHRRRGQQPASHERQSLRGGRNAPPLARSRSDSHAGSLSGVRAVGKRRDASDRIARPIAGGHVFHAARAGRCLARSASLGRREWHAGDRGRHRGRRRAADERSGANAWRAPPTRPRVFFAEWIDPIYCAGHWVPEMIAARRRRRSAGAGRGRFGARGVGRRRRVANRKS